MSEFRILNDIAFTMYVEETRRVLVGGEHPHFDVCFQQLLAEISGGILHERRMFGTKVCCNVTGLIRHQRIISHGSEYHWGRAVLLKPGSQ